MSGDRNQPTEPCGSCGEPCRPTDQGWVHLATGRLSCHLAAVDGSFGGDTEPTYQKWDATHPLTVDRNQPADRDEARRLADAATPGPWNVAAWWLGNEVKVVESPSRRIASDLWHDGQMHSADAEFIAAARSLVPALLDELDATVADRDQLRTKLAEANRALGSEIWSHDELQEETIRLRAQVQADRPDMRDQRQQEISE